jgi:hypothetical protein
MLAGEELDRHRGGGIDLFLLVSLFHQYQYLSPDRQTHKHAPNTMPSTASNKNVL